jgi:hypothetical protein
VKIPIEDRRCWEPEVGDVVVVVTDRWAGKNRFGVVRGRGGSKGDAWLVEILRPDGNVGKKVDYHSRSIMKADAVTRLGLLAMDAVTQLGLVAHPRLKPEAIDGRGRYLVGRAEREHAYQKARTERLQR